MAFEPTIPPDIPWGATNQGTYHGIWGAGTFAVACHGTTLSNMSLQPLETKALSRGITGKSAPILAEITIRKSQGDSRLFLGIIYSNINSYIS